MRFGICLGAKDSLRTPPIHADYIEVSASEIATIEPVLWEQLREAIQAGEIRTYSANNLTPATLRLTGPDVDLSEIERYCDHTFSRLAEIGVRVLVFGSGKSRQVPEGFPMEQAWEQLIEVGRLFARKAAERGQTVVIEPLAYDKVNIIHTIDDGAAYARAIDRENFRVLADFFHTDRNGETVASWQAHGDLLFHTHFASAKARSMPRTEEEWGYFEEMLRALKEIGYDGAMSFEGGIFSTEEFDAMIEKMKEIEKKIEG